MQFASRRQCNLLIQNSTRDGFFLESLYLYSSLVKSSLHGDHLTFPFVFKACAHLPSLREGRKVHSHVVSLGFHWDVFVQTSLVDMYSKCSSLSDARRVFDDMPTRSVVSWNSIISAYSKELHTREAFCLFNQMRSVYALPTSSTFVSLLSGCSKSTSALQLGLSVHCHGIKIGFDSHSRLSNSIMHMYVRFNLMDDALTLLNSSKNRSSVAYTTVIAGYAKLGDCSNAFNLFNQMRLKQTVLDSIVFINLASSCTLLANSLLSSSVLSLLIRTGLNRGPDVSASVVNMYAKCGDITSARKVFDSAMDKNILLWTSMIGGYVRVGLPGASLDLLKDMVGAGLPPNRVTILTALSACASIGSLSISEQIVNHINSLELSSDLQIQTSMIHMYCKCGSLKKAEEIFNAVPRKDLTALSSMINCYASHGKGEAALALFKEMTNDKGIKPDAVVFTDTLSACSHGGFVEEGLECFRRMREEFGIEASKEHYSCMVDLLSRAGDFDSALGFIHRAPIKLRSRLWTPFLSGLRDHNSLRHANIVSNKFLEVGSESAENHVLLAILSASEGKWKEAGNFRILMDKRGLNKEGGWSRIELGS
ncbi:Pentatricopeptide repeat-containing protein [Platanthera zijinensis]|uniref:Pentatricopeptide repeat-containing protein n=1 Tax=Platanthera zijinensis TaxID=2320716 RepID=A0AAP0B7F4_9ASPA